MNSHEVKKLTVAVQLNRPVRAGQTNPGEHRGGAKIDCQLLPYLDYVSIHMINQIFIYLCFIDGLN